MTKGGTMAFRKFAMATIVAAAAFAAAPASASSVLNPPAGSPPQFGALGEDPLFTYTFSIAGADSGTGLLNGTDLGGGQFLITSGSLDVTSSSNGGAAIGTWSLIPNPVGPSVWTSPDGAFNINNVIYTGSNPTLDGWGLLFGNGASEELNIWGNGADNYSFWVFTPGVGYTIADNDGAPGSFSVAPLVEIESFEAAVPEPATWAMFLLGFGAIGFMLRSGRGKQVAVTA